MDGSFFAFGLLGAFLGYIIGDIQRQRRYRREAVANLALANQRANDRAEQRALRARNVGTVTNSNTDSDDNGNWIIAGTLSSQARRRAVLRPDIRNRPGRYAARGDTRSPDAPALVLTREAVGHDWR